MVISFEESRNPFLAGYTLPGVVRLFIDGWIQHDREEFNEVGNYRGERGPIATILDITKHEVFGPMTTTFFVSKKIEWFVRYSDYYDDPGEYSGMMIRADLARRAANTTASVFAIYVESERKFYGMSAQKFWAYVTKFQKIRQSLYEPNVIDAACPRRMWTPMYSTNKHDFR